MIQTPIINDHGFHLGNLDETTHLLTPSPNARTVPASLPDYVADTQAARYVAGQWVLVDKEQFQGNTEYRLITRIHLQDVTPQLIAPLREHEYTVSQNQDIVITANMAWPDGQFRIPMVRTDTQREVPVLGTVLNGVLTVTVNFPTAGYWECGNAQINSRLPAPQFDMPTLQFVVV